MRSYSFGAVLAVLCLTSQLFTTDDFCKAKTIINKNVVGFAVGIERSETT
ncbi:MAG: hypothetical protein LBL65_02550 [Campylobacteraceae bacterium]|nr:hypothetical protein [Campylobacteraceae bacterium]